MFHNVSHPQHPPQPPQKKFMPLYAIVLKNNAVHQPTDYNMEHAHGTLDKCDYRNVLIICNAYSFPLQKWLHKCASALRYTNAAC